MRQMPGFDTEGERTNKLLAVNQAEYVIFRFLCPHQAGDDEQFDPMSNYRIEKSAAKSSTTKKVSA